MKHDESALVKQALHEAREQLQARGRIMPGAYMLVRNNPQTGAPLAHPTALGFVRDAAFTSTKDFDEFLAQLRIEVKRLNAAAVALSGEAEAEIESGTGSSKRRVFYIRIEDLQGVEQLHAAIEPDGQGGSRLGKLLADAGAVDMIETPLLAR